MRRRAIIALTMALFAGAAAFVVTYQAAQHLTGLPRVSAPGAELLWLQREFHLDDSQFVAIKRLHTDYQLKCGDMCRRIAETNGRLSHLLATSRREMTPELGQAIAESCELQRQCREMMLAHLYAVSAQMNPSDAEHYLAVMEPCVVNPGQSFQTLRPSGQSMAGKR